MFEVIIRLILYIFNMSDTSLSIANSATSMFAELHRISLNSYLEAGGGTINNPE